MSAEWKTAIVSAVRTPLCKNGGSLTSVRGETLGALAVKEAVARARIDPARVDEIICSDITNMDVKNIARVVWLEAGLPLSVPGFTVDSACGSSLRGLYLADTLIRAGRADCVAVGGAESCSNRPFLMDRVKDPARYAPPDWSKQIISPAEYENLSNGMTAERVAETYRITRADCDALAVTSHARAAAAWDKGLFDAQIVPVNVPRRKQEPLTVSRDEIFRPDCTMESLAKLPPVFKKDGVVTAGNSSPLTDGASCMVTMELSLAEKLGCTVLGVCGEFAAAGCAPQLMGMGPVYAVKKLMEKTGLTMDDFDLVELNEAFASQTVACARELSIPSEKLNVNGGAIALGHPFTASGGILTARLVYELQRRKAKRGLVTFCIGGGIGVAMEILREE